MAKLFRVEVQFGKTWITVKTEPRQVDALNYIKEHSGERHPYRIVRVVKTVVFEEKK